MLCHSSAGAGEGGLLFLAPVKTTAACSLYWFPSQMSMFVYTQVTWPWTRSLAWVWVFIGPVCVGMRPGYVPLLPLCMLFLISKKSCLTDLVVTAVQFLGRPVWRVCGTGTQGIPSHIQEPSQEPSFFESKMFGKICNFFFSIWNWNQELFQLSSV